MKCKYCLESGWVCEEHPQHEQGHKAFDSYFHCNGAGIPCTCDAFPHKKLTSEKFYKGYPVEFWALRNSNADGFLAFDADPGFAVKYRIVKDE